MITGDDLAGVWSFRDRRRIAFSELNHADFIDASEALKDHSITGKGFTCALALLGSCGPV